MKRRRLANRTLTAEEVVAIEQEVMTAYASASHEVRVHAERQALAVYGYTPVDVFRARVWIRRGRPADYRWDEWG